MLSCQNGYLSAARIPPGLGFVQARRDLTSSISQHSSLRSTNATGFGEAQSEPKTKPKIQKKTLKHAKLQGPRTNPKQNQNPEIHSKLVLEKPRANPKRSQNPEKNAETRKVASRWLSRPLCQELLIDFTRFLGSLRTAKIDPKSVPTQKDHPTSSIFIDFC